MIAAGNASQYVFFKCTDMTDIISEIIINSTSITGNMGGTKGGIPVIANETNGGRMASTSANFQVSKKLPSIIGKNIGKNVGPNPTR